MILNSFKLEINLKSAKEARYIYIFFYKTNYSPCYLSISTDYSEYSYTFFELLEIRLEKIFDIILKAYWI